MPPFEVGEHQDVEQLGACRWRESPEALAEGVLGLLWLSADRASRWSRIRASAGNVILPMALSSFTVQVKAKRVACPAGLTGSGRLCGRSRRLRDRDRRGVEIQFGQRAVGVVPGAVRVVGPRWIERSRIERA
jgi:hypothetical protein